MKKKVLITRVEDDEITRYCSVWIEKKIIPEAERRGLEISDLPRKKANKNRVCGVISSKNPNLILFHGHGNENSIEGYQHQTLIHSDDGSISLLSGKVIHSFTCSSACILGKKAVEEYGALGFIGYKQPFIALNDDLCVSRPLTDEIAKPFMESAMRISEALIKGNTSGEAFKKSQDMYNFWIAFYRAHGDIKDASDILEYLMADRSAQILIGDPNIQAID